MDSSQERPPPPPRFRLAVCRAHRLPPGPALPWPRHVLRQHELAGHLEELRSLLTQSSWEVVSPFPIMLQVLRFFLRCIVPSPSDPDSHWTRRRENEFNRTEPLASGDSTRMVHVPQKQSSHRLLHSAVRAPPDVSGAPRTPSPRRRHPENSQSSSGGCIMEFHSTNTA